MLLCKRSLFRYLSNLGHEHKLYLNTADINLCIPRRWKYNFMRLAPREQFLWIRKVFLKIFSFFVLMLLVVFFENVFQSEKICPCAFFVLWRPNGNLLKTMMSYPTSILNHYILFIWPLFEQFLIFSDDLANRQQVQKWKHSRRIIYKQLKTEHRIVHT